MSDVNAAELRPHLLLVGSEKAIDDCGLDWLLAPTAGIQFNAPFTQFEVRYVKGEPRSRLGSCKSREQIKASAVAALEYIRSHDVHDLERLLVEVDLIAILAPGNIQGEMDIDSLFSELKDSGSYLPLEKLLTVSLAEGSQGFFPPVLLVLPKDVTIVTKGNGKSIELNNDSLNARFEEEFGSKALYFCQSDGVSESIQIKTLFHETSSQLGFTHALKSKARRRIRQYLDYSLRKREEKDEWKHYNYPEHVPITGCSDIDSTLHRRSKRHAVYGLVPWLFQELDERHGDRPDEDDQETRSRFAEELSRSFDINSDEARAIMAQLQLRTQRSARLILLPLSQLCENICRAIRVYSNSDFLGLWDDTDPSLSSQRVYVDPAPTLALVLAVLDIARRKSINGVKVDLKPISEDDQEDGLTIQIKYNLRYPNHILHDIKQKKKELYQTDWNNIISLACGVTGGLKGIEKSTTHSEDQHEVDVKITFATEENSLQSHSEIVEGTDAHE